MIIRRKFDPLLHILHLLWGVPGYFGATVRRKIKRRMVKRSVEDFNACVQRLGASDVVLDLGANLGTFTAILAKTGAEVHAYEPDPHCFDQLQARFAGVPNIFLHNKAVAAEAGTFLLRRTRGFADSPDMESQGSSIAVNDPEIYDENNSIAVDTLAFNDVVKAFDRKVALIKMDIEGAEFAILDRIMSAPDALPIDAMFVETHERSFPDRVAQVWHLRIMNWRGALPFPIDTYWP